MIKAIAVLAFLAARDICFLSTIKSFGALFESHSLFQSWSSEFGKVYKSAVDYHYRLYIFHKNRLRVEAHNSKKSNTFKMGLNSFGDLTSEEFMERYTSKNVIPNPTLFSNEKKSDTGEKKENPSQAVELDPEVDWVSKGVVNPIQNQASCGSCYAFSGMAATESAYAIANPGHLIKFSEQYVVDCGSGKGFKLFGCSGGYLPDVGAFAVSFGVVKNMDYPYCAKGQTCNLSAKPFTRISSFVSITSQKMKDLLAQVMIGPVAISIEVTPIYQFYKTGVMNVKAPCGFFLNHGVTVVGYNLNAEVPYLLIRNSYSEKWGENGYFKHAIGDLDTSGICGFANAYSMRPVI